jgi:preprotein translocase subunit SecD
MSQRYLRLLILVVVIVAIGLYIAWPKSPGIHFGGINKDFQTTLGLDLVGGVQALLEADLPPGTPVDQDAMGAAVNIVENRVGGLGGVTEAVVQKAGDNRIVVELPGETDPETALATLRQTGLLEFVDFSVMSPEEAFIMEGAQIETDFGLTSESQTESIPAPTISSTSTITSTSPITPTNTVYHTIMTGADLKQVAVTTTETGEHQVSFELSPEGTRIFGEFTSQHIGDVLAIVLDKQVISAPRVQSAITDGRGVITGNFTVDTANSLAVQLRYGSLPIPLKVVEVRTVGPSLGQDSLQKSLIAGAIGFTIVTLFMALYYRVPGLLADVSIIIYALLAFAVFRFIPVTLTLAGIAGFLLSTGSALDANILIFERMKEELRSGKNFRQAIDLGWRRAWPSIRDSNIATIITCLILFWFGSTYGATIVKGFSVTLALGVGISLFIALVVTRVQMELLFNFFKSTNFAKWFGI